MFRNGIETEHAITSPKPLKNGDELVLCSNLEN